MEIAYHATQPETSDPSAIILQGALPWWATMILFLLLLFLALTIVRSANQM